MDFCPCTCPHDCTLHVVSAPAKVSCSSKAGMGTQRTRLNQKLVKDTETKGREFVIWDDELTGFGLRVRPSGRKTYVLKYRLHDGSKAQRKDTLGVHPGTSCSAARTRAQEILARVRLGENPSGKATSLVTTVTLNEFWNRYDRDHVAAHLKERSAHECRGLAKRVLLPRLGHLPLEAINPGQVAKMHAALRETPFQANRALALLSAIFSRAIAWEVVTNRPNPCRSVKKYAEKAKERYLTPEEIGALLESLDDHARRNPLFSDAIRLLLFTGMRKSEVLGLRWSEITSEGKEIHLADSKTGKRTIPLNVQAAEIVRSLRERAESIYVFPARDSVTGDGSRHATGLHRFWDQVRKDAGLEGVRIHDLRHTFASFAANEGVSVLQIGGLLGHKNPRTTMRYTHLSTRALQTATDLVGDAIRPRH